MENCSHFRRQMFLWMSSTQLRCLHDELSHAVFANDSSTLFAHSLLCSFLLRNIHFTDCIMSSANLWMKFVIAHLIKSGETPHAYKRHMKRLKGFSQRVENCFETSKKSKISSISTQIFFGNEENMWKTFCWILCLWLVLCRFQWGFPGVFN